MLRSIRQTLAELVVLVVLATHRAAGFGEEGFAKRADFDDRDFDGEGFFEQPDGPNLLVDLNFATPSIQTFPTDGTGGIPFTAIYLCDEGSGNLVDEIGAVALSPVNSPIQGATAVGFFDGSNCYSKKAIEGTDGGTGRFDAAAAATFDVDASTDIAILVVWRTVVSPTATRSLVDKRGTAGYSIDLTSSAGRPRAVFDAGAATDVPAISTGTYDDGAWHACLAVFDRDADRADIFTELGDSGSVTPLTATGSLEDATLFAIKGEAPAQIAFVGLVIGTGARGLGQADLDAFWNHGKQATTPELDTYSRASVAEPSVGNGAGAGLYTATYGSGEFAHAYSSTFSHATKLGALIEGAATNLCLNSENFGAWTAGGAGPMLVSTDFSIAAPDGTRTADVLLAQADNDFVESAAMTVSAGSDYTSSFHYRRHPAESGDVTGRLIIYDKTGLAEEISIPFTATTEWQRIPIREPTAASTSQAIRVEIDTAGEAILAWGAMHNAGYLSSYVRTGGATATRLATVAQLTNTGGDTYVKSTKGEIEIVCALDEDGAALDRTLLDLQDGATNADRIKIAVQASGAVQALIYDSSGTLKQTITAADPGNWDQEHTIRLRWDSEEGVDGNSENADLIVDGVRTAGSATTWTAGTSADTLELGRRRDASTYMQGRLARLAAWDGYRPEAV